MLENHQRSKAALHRRGLAQAAAPVVAPHAHEGAAGGRRILRPPLHLECLELGDTHERSFSFVDATGRTLLGTPTAGRCRRSNDRFESIPSVASKVKNRVIS